MSFAQCSEEKEITRKKMFVLDTNVLLSDPNCVSAFQENDIIIPMVVLEELDRHKTRQDEKGANARSVVRKLEELRKIGSLSDGVTLDSGGIIRIYAVSKESLQKLPMEFSPDKSDNVILATAVECSNRIDKNKHLSVSLVTQDVNLRLKADSLKLLTEGYRNIRVTDESKGIYSGATVCEVSEEQFFAYSKSAIALEIFGIDHGLHPQQFIELRLADDPQHKTIEFARFIDASKPLKKLTTYNAFGLTQKNHEQALALELMLDPSVDLVTATGQAGTGKTLLAVASAFHQVVEKKIYDRIIISRSAQPMGKDIGFLPGTLEEKMQPWIAPIMDNIAFLRSNSVKSKNGDTKQQDGKDDFITMMMEKGTISVEALTFIRGRSIPNTIMILDEVQNMSMHELKTVITRMGSGSKLILTGDLEQIDNPQIDIYSNGLTYAIEKFKDCPFAGHVNLVKGERSRLATYAAKVL
jgi:PhoH-like ATPase